MLIVPLKSKSIKSYFLLDVEMPYVFSSLKTRNKNIAIRFSEYESIETVKFFMKKFKWIFIDTVTRLPINKKNLSTISKFKSCLVCPERWGQKNKISQYLQKLKKTGVELDAVMTSMATVNYNL